MSDPVSATVHINAPAEAVYAMVTDLPRMGQWSPENTGGQWVGGASGAAVGARFRGTNRAGTRSWKTTVTVVDASAPTSFAFETMVGPLAMARWSYRITPSADGQSCDVTEQWDDKRWGPLPMLSTLATGVKDRSSFTKTSIETTLANLKAAAEAS